MKTANSLKAETVKNGLLVRPSPEWFRHAPAGNQTKLITNGLDDTVNKRYKERLKIQKLEPVTDSGSENEEEFL